LVAVLLRRLHPDTKTRMHNSAMVIQLKVKSCQLISTL
jgi:hypothetical protein